MYEAFFGESQQVETHLNHLVTILKSQVEEKQKEFKEKYEG